MDRPSNKHATSNREVLLYPHVHGTFNFINTYTWTLLHLLVSWRLLTTLEIDSYSVDGWKTTDFWALLSSERKLLVEHLWFAAASAQIPPPLDTILLAWRWQMCCQRWQVKVVKNMWETSSGGYPWFHWLTAALVTQRKYGNLLQQMGVFEFIG